MTSKDKPDFSMLRPKKGTPRKEMGGMGHPAPPKPEAMSPMRPYASQKQKEEEKEEEEEGDAAEDDS